MIGQPLDQLTKIIMNALSGVANLRKSFQTFFIQNHDSLPQQI